MDRNTILEPVSARDFSNRVIAVHLIADSNKTIFLDFSTLNRRFQALRTPYTPEELKAWVTTLTFAGP